MRDIDHIASMAMMGVIANNKINPKGAAVLAYQYAEEFMKIAKKKQEEERESYIGGKKG